MKRLALSLALIGLIGCADTAQRRLLIIQQADVVLRHSTTEPAFTLERAQLEANIKEELSSE